MDEFSEYVLTIGAYSPDTMPMARLAEYMGDLAKLLGEQRSVHFVGLLPGSARLVHKVEREADPKVRSRVASVRVGIGPTEAIKAVRSINKRLKEDNGSGALQVGGAEILQFPGREEIDSLSGSVVEQATLDGVVVRVGGTQDWVGVGLQAHDGTLTTCLARRSVAKELAHHLFGQEVRVSGTATWFRLEESWQLERFYIKDFCLLDETPLTEITAELRAVQGSDWPSIQDPWTELSRLRIEGGS